MSTIEEKHCLKKISFHTSVTTIFWSIGAHWMVYYLELVEYYDHALHVRVEDLGETQIPIGVCLKLTTNLDDPMEMHPQRLEYHAIVQ